MSDATPDLPNEINPATPRNGALRWLKRSLLCIFFGLPLIFFIFFQYVNWNGERALERMRGQLKEAGESVERMDLKIVLVASDENFFATPALDGIAGTDGNDESAGTLGAKRKALKALREISGAPLKGTSDLEKAPDWNQWRKSIEDYGKTKLPKTEPDPVRAILAGFEEFRPLFDELGAASSRPYSQITPTLAERSAPPGVVGNASSNISLLLQLGKPAAMQGWLLLASGETDRAATFVRIMIQLSDGLARDGALISYLCANAVLKLAGPVIMEGIRNRQWNEPQLAEWQRRLETCDLDAAALNCMRWEMAESFAMLPVISRMEPSSAAIFPAEEGKTKAFLVRNGPRGWIQQHQAAYVDLMLRFCIIPLKKGGIAAALAQRDAFKAASEAACEGANPGAKSVLSGLPIFGKIMRQIAHCDIVRRHLILACALERHFMKHGSYPSKLEEIAPDILMKIPSDLDGKPVRYSSALAGVKYRLWSVGADLKDDWKGNPPSGLKDVADYLADWILTLP